jgi:hypothetical protein
MRLFSGGLEWAPCGGQQSSADLTVDRALRPSNSVIVMVWLITTISDAREAGRRAAQTIDPSDSGPIKFGALSLLALVCGYFAYQEHHRGNMGWFDGWLAAGILAVVIAYVVYPPPGFYWQRKKTAPLPAKELSLDRRQSKPDSRSDRLAHAPRCGRANFRWT